jgi:hypothetical protein
MKRIALAVAMLLPLASGAQEPDPYLGCTFPVSAIVADVDLVHTATLNLIPRRVAVGVAPDYASALAMARAAARDGVTDVNPAETILWPAHTVRTVAFHAVCQ